MASRRILPRSLLGLLLALVWAALLGCSAEEEVQKIFRGPTPTKPEIRSVTPSQGAVGSVVAVKGVGFGPSPGQLAFEDPTTARFVLAKVSGWADDMIVATVPAMDTATGVLKIGLKTTGEQVPASPALYTLIKN
ncbi:MAG: hypothetical protein HY815_23820 [Candidatus Riflebacteria bacterium]|nr:hypothetical protein [Candidatus Riflebacteria bacterium]